MKEMFNLKASDGVPIIGTALGKSLESAGNATLSDLVMTATLIFTLCKIVPAAAHAWNVMKKFFRKEQ